MKAKVKTDVEEKLAKQEKEEEDDDKAEEAKLT